MAKLSGFIPVGARVLEFGAGTGEQASYLAGHGYNVVAIDLALSDYAAVRVFSVQNYDGHTIPLENQSVDVIFSSNVLEHVENLPEILGEFRRILRVGGFGIHAMPTPSWRLWTFVSGPPAAVKAMAKLIRRVFAASEEKGGARHLLQDFKDVVGPLLPLGHGTSREGISELWGFSSWAWRKRFERNGWRVSMELPIGLFYTGHSVFGYGISFMRRKALSKFLGSSARIYIVEPVNSGREALQA